MFHLRIRPHIWLLPLVILVTTHCGSSDETAAPIELDPAELTLITFQRSSVFGKAEEDVVEQFLENQPNITIDLESYGRFPQSYLESDNPPNIMAMGSNYFLRNAIAKNQLVDMTDLWIETDLINTYPAQLRALSEYNGKQYHLPIGYTWAGVYYNKQLFNQYGLEPPTTWDEFTILCDTLLANGETPLSLSGDDAWQGMMWFSYLNLRLNGLQFHNQLMQGEVPYTDARVRAVLETWQRLLERNYFVENATMMGDLDSITAIVREDNGLLGRQKATMVLASTSDFDGLPAKFRDELDFFRFPIIDPTLPVAEVIETYGYMVPNQAQSIPQALAFLSYMSSLEAQTRLVQQSGNALTYIPAHPGVDQNLLSGKVQRGIGLIAETDAFVSRYMLSSPTLFWQRAGSGLDRFLRNNGDVDLFIETLEKARQDAEAQGLFNP